jgi:hypothetical protein
MGGIVWVAFALILRLALLRMVRSTKFHWIHNGFGGDDIDNLVRRTTMDELIGYNSIVKTPIREPNCNRAFINGLAVGVASMVIVIAAIVYI